MLKNIAGIKPAAKKKKTKDFLGNAEMRIAYKNAEPMPTTLIKKKSCRVNAGEAYRLAQAGNCGDSSNTCSMKAIGNNQIAWRKVSRLKKLPRPSKFIRAS